MKPQHPFTRIGHLSLSPWATKELRDEQTARIEEIAAELDVTVGIVKRADNTWLARSGGAEAIAGTPYDAALMALGKVED